MGARGSGAVGSDRETTVQLSEEVRTGCRFPESTAQAPRFELDQSTLRAPEKNLLVDLASCLKEGPLKDRTLTIVGRTDPRGSSEHNQDLGANRAEATRNYLIARGVPEGRLLVVSRGEEGARGDDESSWAIDRRVDLVLGEPAAGASRSLASAPLPPANPAQVNVNDSAKPVGASGGATTTPLPPANPPQVNVHATPKK